ncbi:DNA cytosine methyltransferase [Bacillus cereus]|uniref:DNA cytosine methyltransferase n=1 Tax=Bacillus cereus TaxID=1396 RepID=UPI0024BEDDA1|nr:DNA cytosine methyltransferase [Bacillus cereus]
MKKKYNVIDLFSGCGGFSSGFERAGYHILLGVDIWSDALKTFQANHKEATILEADLSQLITEQLLKKINLPKEEIDVIIGGPPCQGFSLSGFRDEQDPRNQLYKAFVRTVKDIQPKIFVMENVPGLVKLFKGRAKEAILEDFESIGYHVNHQILTASEFGVPQNRRRVFFVGIKKGLLDFPYDTFEFPEPTHGGKNACPMWTCENALSDLPLLENNFGTEGMSYLDIPKNNYQKEMRKNSPTIYNHIATQHKQQTIDIISMVPDGGNYKDLPEEFRNTRKVNIAWTRMNSQKPCFTIDTGHNHHFHYKANRVPTVRESARIQSFPDDFIFLGTKTSQLKQVGNAVPPLLSEMVAKKILFYLNLAVDININPMNNKKEETKC